MSGEIEFAGGHPAVSPEPGKRHPILDLQLLVDAEAPSGRHFVRRERSLAARAGIPGRIDAETQVRELGRLLGPGALTCLELGRGGGTVIEQAKALPPTRLWTDSSARAMR